MYFPYLRARQFDLLAIREFSMEEGKKAIFPIIEPVKEAFNSLKKALGILTSSAMPYGLILNPQVGDITGKTDYIENNLEEDFKNSDCFYPAFIVRHSTNLSKLIKHIEEHQYHNIILILQSVRNLEENDFITLCNISQIRYFVLEFESRSLKKQLSGKSVIRLKDSFNRPIFTSFV